MSFNKDHLHSCLFFSIILLAITPTMVSSVEEHKIPAEDKATVNTWLFHNCGMEERRLIEHRLKTMGPAVETLLLKALETGPNKALVDEFDRATVRRFDRRRQLIDQGLKTGLSEADLKEAASVTQQDFVNRQKKDFILRYKSQALMGLGMVEGPKGFAILQKMAKEDSELQHVARKALKEITD